jgi:hypothetical protein
MFVFDPKLQSGRWLGHTFDEAVLFAKKFVVKVEPFASGPFPDVSTTV